MDRHEAQLSSNAEGFRQSIRVRGHALTADEPAELGGTDAGPNPYELLCSALAACTSITVEMYARRKGWPLTGTEVRVTHEKVKDGEGPEDRMVRYITFKGDLDAEQRERLAVVAGKCPVHKTLTAGVRVRDEIAD